MKQHKSKYDALYAKSQDRAWLGKFAAADAKIQAAIPTLLEPGSKLAQPNPWAGTDGVRTDSKRYLTRVLGLHGEAGGGPAAAVFAACRRIAAELGGGTALSFEAGPPKREVRIFEKSRMQEGRLDLIRDLWRGMFKVNKLGAMPLLLDLLHAAPEFDVVRGKNRFAPGYNADDSAGYRDYQLVVRTPDGWLVELQVIPVEMYQLKSELGQ